MAMLRKKNPPTRCNIPIAMVTDFFMAKQRAADLSTPIGPPPTQMWQEATPTDLLEAPITSNEIQNTLKRTNPNSAPGPDHLSYAAWKKLDPNHDIITAILNTCRVNAKVPPSWKGSTTILIFKGNAVIWITSGHRTLSDQFRQLTGRIAHARTRCLRNERE